MSRLRVFIGKICKYALLTGIMGQRKKFGLRPIVDFWGTRTPPPYTYVPVGLGDRWETD